MSQMANASTARKSS